MTMWIPLVENSILRMYYLLTQMIDKMNSGMNSTGEMIAKAHNAFHLLDRDIGVSKDRRVESTSSSSDEWNSPRLISAEVGKMITRMVSGLL
jgi:hypothetical protein